MAARVALRLDVTTTLPPARLGSRRHPSALSERRISSPSVSSIPLSHLRGSRFSRWHNYRVAFLMALDR